MPALYTASSDEEFNSVALYAFEYDSSVLRFEGFSDYNAIEEKCLFGGGFDNDKQIITLALSKSEALKGSICGLRFAILSEAEAGIYDISFSSLVKQNSDIITSTAEAGSVTVEKTAAPHVHEMVRYDAQTPTCHSAGNIEYFRCVSCGKMFSDLSGNSEIADAVLPIDANNHTGGSVIKDTVDPGEYTNGYTGDKYCLGCGEKLLNGEIIPAYGSSELETEAPEISAPADDSTDEPEDDFEEPDENTSDAESIPEWENPFVDVDRDHPFYDAIQFAYENGLFKGVSSIRFAPDSTMTRAMFVTVLGRYAGVDPVYFPDVSFDDSVPGEWYAPYVEWAAQNGIVEGYGNGKFGVDNPITVEQAVVILARFAKHTGETFTSPSSLSEFEDADTISVWAFEQMKWAVDNEIYAGENHCLYPQSHASRALIADMLYSFIIRQ